MSLAALAGAASISAATGADLNGWSALALLGSAPDSRPWLFVNEPSAAWLSSRLPDANFACAVTDYRGAWPFPDSSLAGVVLDGDAMAHHATDAAIEMVRTEAARVTGAGGNVLILCGERRIPRTLRAWRGYRRSSAETWLRAFARAGDAARTVAHVRFESDRLTDIVPGTPQSDSPVVLQGGGVVLRRGSCAGRDDCVLQSIVGEFSLQCGMHLHVDRVAVRKIGKTAVFLSGPEGHRYLVRIPRSRIAVARAARNFQALQWLSGSALETSFRKHVPQPLWHGSLAGFDYFAEGCLPGRPGPLAPATGTAGWPTEAVTFITALHRATAERVRLDGPLLDRLVFNPIERVTAMCGSRKAESILRGVARRCERALRGRTLPIVRTHGDLTESNCLFDDEGRLSAVVDWELSQAAGLPFLDLLQLMPVRGEIGHAPRWQRFGAWMELYRAPERIMSDQVMGTYVRTFDIEEATLPVLILTQWITHVADRIAARYHDDRWMRLRFRHPLDRLGRMLRD